MVDRTGWQETGKKEVDEVISYLLSELQNVKGRWGDFLRELVSQTKVINFFPIYAFPPDRPWARGRCQILGDAAHVVPPWPGQGVTMALEDVFLLSRLLKDQRTSTIEECLARFEQIRRPRVSCVFSEGLTESPNIRTHQSLGSVVQRVFLVDVHRVEKAARRLALG